MMKLLVAAALAGVVKGQSQCSPDYLAQINTLCCTDASGQDICHGVCARALSLCLSVSVCRFLSRSLCLHTGGEPTLCNGNCATMFLVRTSATTCRSLAPAL